MRALLGVDAREATPAQVMKAILKLPVDLLWFGGIGTYVRSSVETDDRVGDRANDALRIAGREIKAKVIGEGANLGMTQLGRVEAATAGVRLNTDAIDNSAGVNSSDLEVNLKIALAIPIREQRLTLEGRNELLVSMTKDVAALVLRNNYMQPLAISLAERRGLEDLGFEIRLMQILERKGLLDRAVEFLPSDAELADRRKRGAFLTRPELAVMLAYAKIALFGELLASRVPDDPYLARELVRYFPKPVVERFPEALKQHRLRREIVATMLANSMINRGGPSLIARVGDETGADSPSIALAFTAARDAYELTELNGEIDRLDNKIDGALQLELYAAVQNLHLGRINWFLRHAELAGGLAKFVTHYRAGIAEVEAALESAQPDEQHARRKARAAELMVAGVPEALARKLARLRELADATDIILVAGTAKRTIADVTGVYFAAGAYFKLDRIVAAAYSIELTDHFDRLALDRALVEIASSQRSIATAALATGKNGADAVDAWVGRRRREIERVRDNVHEIASSGMSLSKLAVAVGLLADLGKT
jgi:glutamate dehydrogenase